MENETIEDYKPIRLYQYPWIDLMHTQIVDKKDIFKTRKGLRKSQETWDRQIGHFIHARFK